MSTKDKESIREFGIYQMGCGEHDGWILDDEEKDVWLGTEKEAETKVNALRKKHKGGFLSYNYQRYSSK